MPIDSDELTELNDSLIQLHDFIESGRDEQAIPQRAKVILDGPAAPLLRTARPEDPETSKRPEHPEWHEVMDDYFRSRRKPPLNTSHFRCDLLDDEQRYALHDLVCALAQVVVITDILKNESAAEEKLDGLIIDSIEAKRTKLISDMPKLFSAYFDITIKSHKPVWNGKTLTYRGQIVKKFRKRAPNQMCVLENFQELDWPHEIDDPLPETADAKPYERVNDTAKNLNKGRKSTVIEFATNGNGTGFIWRKVSNQSANS